MKFGTLKLVNGQAVETDVVEVDQNKLSGECWLIQFQGLDACKGCEFLNKRGCGGKSIRKKLMNNKGIKVPVR